MEKVTTKWLEETNEELQSQGIRADDKERLAIAKWRKENAKSLIADKETDLQVLFEEVDRQIEKIKSYFLTQQNKDRGYIQPPFVGIFYYERNFWEVTAPFILGRSGVNFFECLKMPDELKRMLFSDKESLEEYVSICADSLDYAYAIEEVESKCPCDFSKELFRSADKHLRATISLLNQEKANSKAIEDARMSVEIFLKAYLSVKENLTDDEYLRTKIRHNLVKASNRCIADGLNELTQIKQKLANFPNVEARYEDEKRTLGELWDAYKMALTTGTVVLRDLTNLDCRSSIRYSTKE